MRVVDARVCEIMRMGASPQRGCCGFLCMWYGSIRVVVALVKHGSRAHPLFLSGGVWCVLRWCLDAQVVDERSIGSTTCDTRSLSGKDSRARVIRLASK